MARQYSCNSCHGYSDELTRRWFPFWSHDDVGYYDLCPKCVEKTDFFASEEEAEAHLITRKLLDI